MKKLLLLLMIGLSVFLLGGCNSGGQGNSGSAPLPTPASDGVVINFDYAAQSGWGSNQFAVWIEDMDGKHIKTLYATRYTVRRGYIDRVDCLPVWVESSNLPSMTKEEADAIAGATPKSKNLSYFWDLTDQNGDTVPNGEYRYKVEASLRWDNRSYFSGVVEVGGASEIVQSNTEYVYGATEDGPALTSDSPENSMISSVTAQFIPVGSE